MTLVSIGRDEESLSHELMNQSSSNGGRPASGRYSWGIGAGSRVFVVSVAAVLVLSLCLASVPAQRARILAPGVPYIIYGYTFDESDAKLPSCTLKVVNRNSMNSSIISSDSGGYYQFDLSGISGGYQTGDEIWLMGSKTTEIGLNSTSVTGSGGKWMNLTLNPHTPIRIDSDSDFDAFHGVAGGSGTALDPFIIERRDVDGTGFGYCIYVGNTTAHFVVRNCTFTNASMDSPPYRELALTLSNVTNGQVRDNELSDSHRGIGLTSGTSSCEIVGNHLFNISEVGIRLFSSCSNNVSSNNCSYDSCGILMLIGSNYNIVSNNTASYETIGIYVYACSDSQIRGNTCTNNGQSGIVLSQTGRIVLENNNCSFSNPGMLIYGGQENVISNNTVLHNSIGILFQAWAGNDTVVDNNCSSNTGTGIYLDTSTDNFLSNNTCNLNAQHGVYLVSSGNNDLRNNTCNLNAQHGMYLVSSSSNDLSNNTCSGNLEGIYLTASSSNSLTNNNCSYNVYRGTYLYSSSSRNTLSNNIYSHNLIGIDLYSSNDNTMSNNTCNSNAWDGIYLDSSCDNILLNNSCRDNGAAGIRLYSASDRNTVSSNTCDSNARHGIYLTSSSISNVLSNNTCSLNVIWGICLELDSSRNTVDNNDCSDNSGGIYLGSSSNGNTVDNNTCSDVDTGIRVYASSDNNLVNNTCLNDDFGIIVDASSDRNNLTDNTCLNGGYGMYLSTSNGNKLSNNTCSSNNPFGIAFYSSSNNILVNNSCSDNFYGIYLSYSSNNNVLNSNNCSNNQAGIYLHSSSDSNTICCNRICNNTDQGAYILSGSDNIICNNTFIGNNGAGDVYNASHIQAYDDGTNNWWNSTDGYGNWWSDWTRPDANGNGIVDIPYIIQGTALSQDNYPRTPYVWGYSFTLHLLPGWNFVSLPLVDFACNASSLGLATGDVVCKFDSSTQLYSSVYIVGITLPSFDFEICLCMGYFIWTSVEKNLTLLGNHPDKYSSYSIPLDVPAVGGWVSIGWTSFDSSRHASDVASCVTGANAKFMCKWDAGTGRYLSYVVGISPPPYDFVILPGDAMWMWVDGPGGTLTYSP